MRSITPCLWFDDDLEQAVEFYTSVFPDSKVHGISRRPDGAVLGADFEIGGQLVKGLNGGPQFRLDEAFSFFVECESQDEVDHWWDVLTADGGEESQCGWLKDRFGVSWQIVPARFLELLSTGTPEQVGRVLEAMMPMRKLDLAALEAAYEG